ncbi:hypothetical protein LEP1GSC062_0952 [Leptospira alexanderi serovar Manhao 3 str. L 60]|uniref:Uncharacterized protein n=1 Tax=Leptospira alexanderi serovar Manhao 3 str. L 60 TaxID=1049759 RepID=V6I8H0_9LEPT|nr:hypothetical protein LEP1GSC062_0952 [Leptospira alexanderi serovar Manhao 3 str. L 60]
MPNPGSDPVEDGLFPSDRIGTIHKRSKNVKIFLIGFSRMIVCWSSVQFSAFAFIFPFFFAYESIRNERIIYI